MLLISLFTIFATALAFKPCGLRKFENLVVFGDSYSDEGRLHYFLDHNGKAPPAGKLLPPASGQADGGYIWGRFVADITGAKLYDYAVQGATCSNDIVSRYLPLIDAPFPTLLEYEIPAYKKDLKYPALYASRHPDNTVYAVWIGGNDLGYGGFLTDSQAPGTTISTCVDCVWKVFDKVYDTGGRNFILFNIQPFQLSPLYAAQSAGGAGNNQYWPDKERYNETEYQYKMLEYSTDVNTMFEYGAPFELLVKRRWPGVSFSLYDVHSLMVDIFDNPSEYLASPANATGYYHSCNPKNPLRCVNATEPADSFMWYDELHVSERVEQIVARNFIDVLNGHSKYETQYVA